MRALPLPMLSVIANCRNVAALRRSLLENRGTHTGVHLLNFFDGLAVLTPLFVPLMHGQAHPAGT